MRNRLAAVFPILAFGSSLGAVPPAEQQAWEEDLRVYASELEARHIELFHHLSREEFGSQLDAIRENLSQSSEPEIVVQVMRLTHSIGDGHSAVPLWGSGYRRFPIEVRWVSDGAMITSTQTSRSSLLGARIISVDGRPINEIYAALAPYVPFVENTHSEAVRVAQYLNVAELLHAIEVTDSVASANFEIEQNGVSSSIQLDAIDGSGFDESVSMHLRYRSGIENEPGYMQIGGASFALLDDGQLGYIRIDTYPSEEEIDAFATHVLETLQRSGTENLIIDFRGSFGGNFFVGLELASYLVAIDGLNWRDGMYVLTSGTTFSAAMSNAAQFSDILNARLIGEPTGADPCGYQDMGQFTLPNSGLLITYSKRRYCFAPSSDGALQPDVRIDVIGQDYRESRDQALAWIRADIESRSRE